MKQSLQEYRWAKADGRETKRISKGGLWIVSVQFGRYAETRYLCTNKAYSTAHGHAKLMSRSQAAKIVRQKGQEYEWYYSRHMAITENGTIRPEFAIDAKTLAPGYKFPSK